MHLSITYGSLTNLRDIIYANGGGFVTESSFKICFTQPKVSHSLGIVKQENKLNTLNNSTSFDFIKDIEIYFL